MATQKPTLEIIQENGFRNWYNLMNEFKHHFHDADFNFQITIKAHHGPGIYQITYGEIVFNAMNEISERLTDKEDFETFCTLSRTSFLLNEIGKKAISFEKKISFLAFGY